MSSDGWAFQFENPQIADLLDHIGAVLHRHDAHAAMANPTLAPTLLVDSTGGAQPSNTTIYIQYTLTDGQGGESLPTTVATVTTPAGYADPTSAPTAVVSTSAGTMLASTPMYAVSVTDGLGGETALGPPVSVTVPPAPNAEVTISGLTAITNTSSSGASGAGWRLWRSVDGGNEWDLMATGSHSTDTFVDTGSSAGDCSVEPLDTGTTGDTGLLHVTVPGGQPAAATLYSIYASTDGSFVTPCLLGTYAIASAGTGHTFTDLTVLAGQPPRVSRCYGGANKIDPDTDILNWTWKQTVATVGALPTVGNTDGDARVVLSDYSVHIWNAGTSTWSALSGGTSGVSSFNARTGAVAPASGDYTAAQVTNAADKSSGSQQAFTGELASPDFKPSGLTGATATTRFVGGTASGAPVTGTFALGDFIIDQTGKVWICTTAGSPGTWIQVSGGGGAVSSVFGRTGAVTAQPGDYTAAQVTNAADKSSSAQQAFTGEVEARDFAVAGLTGATAAGRYVGTTTSGAPVTGTFSKGDWVTDQAGIRWTCTTAGTPGTWTQEPGSGGGGVAGVSSFNSRTGAVAPGNADYLAVASGLTGATAATRYVGGTSSGAPASGTFAVGDFVIDQTAKVWVCTTAGTPGSWTSAAGSGGTSTLAALTDVSLSAPAAGQGLVYNTSTSKWNNGAATRENVNTVATSGASQTIPDPWASPFQTLTDLTLTAACTLTFPTAAAGKSFTIMLRQDGTGSRTVSWPGAGAIVWLSGGGAPVLSTAASAVDVVTFICTDGTHWVGAFSPGYSITAGGDDQWIQSIDTFAVSPTAKVGTWSTEFGEGANYPNGGCYFMNTSHAQNDAAAWKVPLSAGTWTINVPTQIFTNRAIITVQIDGSSVGTLDAYNASDVGHVTVLALTGVTVGSSGVHEIRLLAATKNASSTDYYMQLFPIGLTRTA